MYTFCSRFDSPGQNKDRRKSEGLPPDPPYVHIYSIYIYIIDDGFDGMDFDGMDFDVDDFDVTI